MIRELSTDKASYLAQLESALDASGMTTGDLFAGEGETPTDAPNETATDEAPSTGGGVSGVIRGVVGAVGRGAMRAGNELSNTAFSLGKGVYKHSGLYKLGRDSTEEAEFLEWYEQKTSEVNPLQVEVGDRAEGALGFLETATQFAVGLLGVGKIVKPLQLASKATRAAKALGVGKGAVQAGKTAQMATEGLITDMAAFDPYEERLSDMIEHGPSWMSNPITSFLAADADDTEAERRVKAGLEGLMTGAAVSGVIRGLKALKIKRLFTAGKVSEEEALKQINNTLSEETIVSAASRIGDEVGSGVDHTGAYRDIATRLGIDLDDEAAADAFFNRVEAEAVDGYLTSSGRFVTREEGMEIAKKSKQLSEAGAASGRTKLNSEDIHEVDEDFRVSIRGVADEAAQVFEDEGGFVVRIKGQEEGLPFTDRARAESTAAAINTAVKVSELPTDKLTEDQTRAIFEIHKRIMENPDGMDVENLIEGISINFPRWQAPDEVKAMVNAMIEAVPEPGKSMRNRSAEGLGKSMKEVYRGALKRTFYAAENPAEARQMAEEFFGDTENLDEKVVALYDIMAARGKEVIDLSTHADIHPDNPAAMDNLVQATEDYLRLLWNVNAGSSNIGRALNAHKYKTAGELAEAVERSVDDAIADPANSTQQLNEFLSGFTKGDLIDMARQIRLSDGDPEGLVNVMKGMRAKVANRKNPDPKFWEKLLGFRTEMMLSGPSTQLINVLNNALIAFQVPAETWWAGVRSGNSALRQEGTDQLVGAFAYLKDAARMARKAWSIGDNVLDPGHRVDEFRPWDKYPGGGFLHQMAKAPSRALLTADEFFKQLTYRAHMRSRSLRLAREQATDMGLQGKEFNDFISRRVQQDLKASVDLDGRAVNAKALQAARYTTHTQSLDYGIGKWVQEGAAKHPLMRIVFPFVRTPVNIFRFTWERTPVLNRFNRRHKAMLEAGGEQAAVAKARADAGMLMYSMGAMLVTGGMITGSGPKDGRMREMWLNAGNQPYSIRLGDTQISYRRLEPLATPLALISDFVQAVGDLNEDDATNMVSASVAALMSSVSSKTFLMGMTEFFDAMASGDAWKVDRLISNLTTSFMPNALRQVNSDEMYRETRSLLDDIYARTPGWSNDLEPRRNLFGEPVLKAPGYFNRSMNPFTVMDAPDDEVMAELLELGANIPMPGEQLSGGRIDLTDRSKYDNGTGQSPYDRLLELMGDAEAMGGRTLRERMTELVKSNRWESFSVGTDEFPGGQRLDAARRIVNNYQARALKIVRREYPLVDQAVRTTRQEKIAAMRGSRDGGTTSLFDQL